MADRMFSDFGMNRMEVAMPSMMRDPFKNDPFFADSGFGKMDSMFNNMHKEMNQMMKKAMSGGGFSSGGGPGHYMK